MPEALRTADSHSSKLMGELIWRKTVATTQPNDLMPALPHLRAESLSSRQPGLGFNLLQRANTDPASKIAEPDGPANPTEPAMTTQAFSDIVDRATVDRRYADQSTPRPIPPEFANPPPATETGPAILIWDSARMGQSFDREWDAVRAAFRLLQQRCRGPNECGGNIYKIGDRYYFDLYQGFSPYGHNLHFRRDSVAWFHNHPDFASEDKHLGFKRDLTKPMGGDPDALQGFVDRNGRPLGAYIRSHNRTYYYQNYLKDKNGIVVPD
jgi:hypothetical protein